MLTIEDRNLKIIELASEGLSTYEITNYQSEGDYLCINPITRKRISQRAVQKVVSENKHLIDKENLLQLYQESGNLKHKNLPLEDAWGNLLSLSGQGEFLESCGYIHECYRNTKSRRKVRNNCDGLFYIVRYKDTHFDIIKFGITSTTNRDKRWKQSLCTNRRRGGFSDSTQFTVLHEFVMDEYEQARQLEYNVKLNFPSEVDKSLMPDGYSESIIYSDVSLAKLLRVIQDSDG